MSASAELQAAIAALLFQNDDTVQPLPSMGSGLQASTTPGSLYVGLHTADVGESGNQLTNEISYTGTPNYIRQAIARASGAGGFFRAAGLINNQSIITFPAMSGGTGGLASHWSIGTAQTGSGRVLIYGAFTGTPFVCTCLDSTDVVTAYAHGLANDDRVVFYALQGATGLPTNVTHGAVYWVISATTNTFQISTTQGGSAVNFGANGGGYVAKLSPINVSVGVTPQIPAQTLDVSFD